MRRVRLNFEVSKRAGHVSNIHGGIVTWFIKPRDFTESYKNGMHIGTNGFSSVYKGIMLLFGLATYLAIPFLLLDFTGSIDGFMRVLTIAVTMELIYKSTNSTYKYF